MLPKPVTAFALSAIVSIATLTASSAMAAPSSDTVASAQASSKAHGKSGKSGSQAKASKKATKKSGHLALALALHGAEPKESPKALPKLPASMSSKLELKNASQRSSSAGQAHSHKPTVVATGKETFIGGPTGHGSKGAVDHSKVSGKLAANTSGVAHGSAKIGPMSKAGRAPSRAVPASVNEQPASDDHPALVSVALRTGAKPVAAPKPPCMHEPIEFVRGAETERFAVTRCDGEVAPLATERLSVLVRPESAAHPGPITELAKVKSVEIAPGVRRIDRGLLARIQLIADHFAKPGMPERISIVSGYRPTSAGSFHATGQALDFHLEGVPNEALVEFCKTLENTGCGYYPNSSFVHVDVRAPGTGHVAWIDASGPGEPARYVATWPPPPEPNVSLAEADADDMANPYKELLQAPGAPMVKESEKAPPAAMNTPLKLKDWE
jgi:hypothetical protein